MKHKRTKDYRSYTQSTQVPWTVALGRICGRLVDSTGKMNLLEPAACSLHQKRVKSDAISAAMENRLAQDRIRVRQGEEFVVLMPGVPTLSSARSPWEGALLERHSFGPYTFERHQHLSHFVRLHIGEPAPMSWRSQGKQGMKVSGPGSIFVWSRGSEHSVSFPDSMAGILVNLEPNLLQQVLPENDRGRDVELIDQWGVHDRQVEHILRTLEADLEDGLPGGRLFGDSLLCALAVRLQCSYGVTPPKNAERGNGLPRVRLNRVIEYIEANLHREIALSALADTAGMSPHYFSELFKQSVHFSPYQYVLRRRIEHARKLLHEPSVSVLEAAVRSGFSDQGQFTKVFRRIVGITPTGYRAAL
jgi:AraC family transcriptional regulator